MIPVDAVEQRAELEGDGLVLPHALLLQSRFVAQ
jgi:hypothetical protein